MSDKVIALENTGEPFQTILRRVMRMVPDRDKNDRKLQRLLAFRLKNDGEAATSEYLIRKLRELVDCAYTDSFYEFIKNDIIEKECFGDPSGDPPGAA